MPLVPDIQVGAFGDPSFGVQGNGFTDPILGIRTVANGSESLPVVDIDSKSSTPQSLRNPAEFHFGLSCYAWQRVAHSSVLGTGRRIEGTPIHKGTEAQNLVKVPCRKEVQAAAKGLKTMGDVDRKVAERPDQSV